MNEKRIFEIHENSSEHNVEQPVIEEAGQSGKDKFEGLSEKQIETLQSLSEARQEGNIDDFSFVLGFSKDQWEKADTDMKRKLLINGRAAIEARREESQNPDIPENQQQFHAMTADEAERMLASVYATVEDEIDEESIQQIQAELQESPLHEGFTREEQDDIERRLEINDKLEAYGDILNFSEKDWREASDNEKETLILNGRSGVASLRQGADKQYNKILAIHAEEALDEMANALAGSYEGQDQYEAARRRLQVSTLDKEE